jgi:hypothetical protein
MMPWGKLGAEPAILEKKRREKRSIHFVIFQMRT